ILAGAGLLSCWRLSTSSTTGAPTTWGLAGIATGIVIALGVLTWNQVQIWHDSERLWTYALAIDPDSPIAHSNLGELLDRQGRPAEAIDHFQQALRLKPDFALAQSNWGAALLQQGKPAEAINHFQQALRINPDFALARSNWAPRSSSRVSPWRRSSSSSRLFASSPTWPKPTPTWAKHSLS